MNKIISLSAITLVAVVMGMSAFAPAAMADRSNQHDPVTICHYDFNVGDWEDDKVVNPHALGAHLAHGDKIIHNSEHGSHGNHITTNDCNALTDLS